MDVKEVLDEHLEKEVGIYQTKVNGVVSKHNAWSGGSGLLFR